MIERLLSIFRKDALKVEQPAGLISVLADLNAPLGDRDDAAMDLGEFDSALNTLAYFMSREAEDEMIVDSCAESIWSIWQRTLTIEESIFNAMPSHWQAAVLDSEKSWTNAQD